MQKFSSTLENYKFTSGRNCTKKKHICLELALPTMHNYLCEIQHTSLSFALIYGDGHTVYTKKCFQIVCFTIIVYHGDILHTRWKMCRYKTIYNYTVIITINIGQANVIAIYNILYSSLFLFWLFQTRVSSCIFNANSNLMTGIFYLVFTEWQETRSSQEPERNGYYNKIYH